MELQLIIVFLFVVCRMLFINSKSMKYILFLLVFLNANYSFGKHIFARLVSSEYSAKYSYQNQSINLIFQTDSTVLLQVGSIPYYGKYKIMNNYITISDFRSNNELNFMAAYSFINSPEKIIYIYVKKNGILIWNVDKDANYFRIIMNKILWRKKYICFWIFYFRVL